MIVKMIENSNRKSFSKLSNALAKAYNLRKAVLVTQGKNFVCAYIPNHEEHIICIEQEGICLVKGEFIDFDDPEQYNWEDCEFEVIDTDNIKIEIERD